MRYLERRNNVLQTDIKEFSVQGTYRKVDIESDNYQRNRVGQIKNGKYFRVRVRVVEIDAG